MSVLGNRAPALAISVEEKHIMSSLRYLEIEKLAEWTYIYICTCIKYMNIKKRLNPACEDHDIYNNIFLFLHNHNEIILFILFNTLNGMIIVIINLHYVTYVFVYH